MKTQDFQKFIDEVELRFQDTPHTSLTNPIANVRKWAGRKGDELDSNQAYEKFYRTVLDYIDIDTANTSYVSAYVLLNQLYSKAAKNRGYDSTKQAYGDYLSLVKQLSKAKSGDSYTVYNTQLLDNYTEEELTEAGTWIKPERDLIFNFIGLYLLQERYLATPVRGEIYELPQERFLTIALVLSQKEPIEKRMAIAEESYWALSNLYMTVATPTLSNAGQDSGQLSSCFIDTMGDSIDGIYDTNKDTARVSKWGGGVGVYMGKVRSRGTAIRGYEGASNGVVPWIKQLNQTAVSVDQLGQRLGAVAVYLDVFHKDIFSFLDLKLNNGDERLRAHDVFTGVCIPDLFMEKVEAREDWYLFEGYYTEKYLGFRLENFYDEKLGEGSFRDHYALAVEAAENGTLPKQAFEKVRAMDVMKAILKSSLETGVPYQFYRDTVNRMNANNHKGMIYASNLCSEITQNMSATEVMTQYLTDENGDDIIVTKQKPGDYVVCNLSSLNLGRVVPADKKNPGILKRVIEIEVRMLDNVIDINNLPLEQAKRTNLKYRPVGLGTFGWAHLLAEEGIHWESEEAVNYADTLYENIAYAAISASADLAIEKGSYDYFEGSDWQTGAYFDKREYVSDDWVALKEKVAATGIRNGYLMAVAPNSSTAKIGGSSDGVDPFYGTDYFEEKKNFKFKVIAPGLTYKNYNLYQKTRYDLDPIWAIRQNSKRQRHIDQSISFNIYVYSTVHAKDLLNYYLESWKQGLKTVYYLKSSTYDASGECENCHS